MKVEASGNKSSNKYEQMLKKYQTTKEVKEKVCISIV
jgi:hypothetical protein